MDPEKKVWTLFSLLNMESPRVQKVSHWLSKNEVRKSLSMSSCPPINFLCQGTSGVEANGINALLQEGWLRFPMSKWSYGMLPNSRPTHTIHGTGIFTYSWLILMVNVGKYTSPMDGMGWTQHPNSGRGTFRYIPIISVLQSLERHTYPWVHKAPFRLSASRQSAMELVDFLNLRLKSRVDKQKIPSYYGRTKYKSPEKWWKRKLPEWCWALITLGAHLTHHCSLHGQKMWNTKSSWHLHLQCSYPFRRLPHDHTNHSVHIVLNRS